jgi:hypothetical protein
MLASVILVLLAFLYFSGRSRYESVAIQGRIWDRNAHTDYGGNDIKDVMPISRAGCAQLCQDTSGCMGFVRNDMTGQCWLKSDMGTRSAIIQDRYGYILM